MEKTLVIMRGLPWTGKSYRAKELAGEEGVIFSTDDYWYTQVKPDCPEEYSFNPRLLAVAHKWNQLRAQDAIHWEKPLIIIDNTNTTAREFCCTYVCYAHINEYKICIEEPTSDRWAEIRQLLRDKKANKKLLKEWAKKLEEGSRETHSVPAYAIERMMWRWECDLNPEEVLKTCEEQASAVRLTDTNHQGVRQQRLTL
jgi:adenylate kinase family enzyme